jgi:1-acyl-sn-glycerol-3-phosphate acyltransferase
MIFIRSLIFNILCYGTGALWGLFSVVCWLLPKPVRATPMLWWLQFTLWHLRWICGVKVAVVNHNGDQPLPCPAVILSKHQSTWETWFLQLYFWPVATILKQELLYVPFFGWGLALFRPIVIDRSTRIQAAKQVKAQGVERLGSGWNVLVFPEGTRVPLGQKRPFARSGVDLAAAAGVPIIPVTHNAGDCWPAKSFLKFPGTVTVTIGRPIDTSARSSREIIHAVQAWVEAGGNPVSSTSVVGDIPTPQTDRAL